MSVGVWIVLTIVLLPFFIRRIINYYAVKKAIVEWEDIVKRTADGNNSAVDYHLTRLERLMFHTQSGGFRYGLNFLTRPFKAERLLEIEGELQDKYRSDSTYEPPGYVTNDEVWAEINERLGLNPSNRGYG